MNPSPRLVAALAVAAVATAATSCSTADTTAGDRPAAPATSTAGIDQPAAHNDDDVTFAQTMIPHHEQAVQLSGLVPSRSTDPRVIELAAAIAAQQQPEITAMRAMLVQWELTPGDHAGHDMAGTVDGATMTRLEGLRGAAFDTLWLESMIAHHEGAIEMADAEIADGRNPDMLTLARNVVAAQRAEIEQMRQLLAAQGG